MFFFLNRFEMGDPRWCLVSENDPHTQNIRPYRNITVMSEQENSTYHLTLNRFLSTRKLTQTAALEQQPSLAFSLETLPLEIKAWPRRHLVDCNAFRSPILCVVYVGALGRRSHITSDDDIDSMENDDLLHLKW